MSVATFGAARDGAVAWSRPSAIWMHDRVSPSRVLGAVCLIWLVVLVVAPVEPRWPADPSSIFLLVAGIGAIAFGFHLPGLLLGPERVARPTIAPWRFRSVLRMCALIGAAGVACRYFDFFILRDVSVTDTIDVARERVARSESSIFSAAAMLLSPFATGAFLLAAAGKKLGFVKKIGLVNIALIFAIPLAIVLVGSRSALLMLAETLALAYLGLIDKVRPRDILLTAGAGVGVLILFNLIFLLRVEQSQADLQLLSRYSAYTLVVPASREFLDFADGLGDLRPLASGLMSMLQYALHGAFEFFYVVELKQENFAGGSYIFFFLPKIVAFVSGQSTAAADAALELANPRSGVFQTFMGPAYVDFGWFSIVFAMAYGACVGLTRRSLMQGNVFALPLYILFLQQVALAPFVNPLVSASGLMANIVLAGLAMGGAFYGGLATRY